MNKYILTLLLLACLSPQVLAEDYWNYTPRNYEIPLKMPSPQPIQNGPGLSEVISRKEHYQPWAYYPIQTHGGSTFLPNGQPTSQGSGGSTFVLY